MAIRCDQACGSVWFLCIFILSIFIFLLTTICSDCGLSTINKDDDDGDDDDDADLLPKWPDLFPVKTKLYHTGPSTAQLPQRIPLLCHAQRITYLVCSFSIATSSRKSGK